MIWLAVQALRPGDVFIRQDCEAAKVVSIIRNEKVYKVKNEQWYVPSERGYVPTDNPIRTTWTIDERDRFLLLVDIFGRDQRFHPHASEMNLHKDAIVLVVNRGPE